MKRKEIEELKKIYPKGTEIELISMNDSQAVPKGTHGVVDHVDDMGTIHMKWDTGSTLGLIIGEDQFRIIKQKNNKIEELTCSEVINLSNKKNEYLILQGCGGDLNEWVEGITNMFKEEGIVNNTFSFSKVYSFQNNNLMNLAFKLDENIDIGKLAIFRLRIREPLGAMWLSDYIDNGYIKNIEI